MASGLGPGSVVWRVSGDWTMMLGGGRALILQVAHPTVAAGVSQFSDYESAPWERLTGTLDLYLRVIYGGRSESTVEAGERLRDLHKRIKGVDAYGNRYHALDPHSFHWVHATLVDSMVEMNARFGRRPMTTLEKELFYEEMCEVAKLYGLREQDMPPDWSAFRAYFDEMVHTELKDSDTLQNVIRSVFRPVKPPVLPVPDQVWYIASWPGAELLRLTTVGSLPRELRHKAGLDWSREKDLALRAQAAAIRTVFPRLPDRLRLMPPAFAARRGETLVAA
ncbi:MAG: hypothetical protein QOF37_1037 [Thermoleophilaceae bacterium]|jgi:uncharacterized protein (DUF2236 family)|nr:hypothetical protein [Thermoleophilaceae bacterium]